MAARWFNGTLTAVGNNGERREIGGGASMKYQNSIEPAQAQEAGQDETGLAARFCEPKLNPVTGLATDYLNHFNEAIMLLEMLSSCPDCLDDFLAWQPLSYREHFEVSRFKGRDQTIAAYEAADPRLRESLDALTFTMTAMLKATRTALISGMPAEAAGLVAEAAAAGLKPLVARAGALINGDTGVKAHPVPQALVDGLMKR